MSDQDAGEALPRRRPPTLTPETLSGNYAFARNEWRPLLRTRNPERRREYVLSCLRVFAFVHGFELFEDEVAAVRRALGEL